jgi:hypothetical protein
MRQGRSEFWRSGRKITSGHWTDEALSLVRSVAEGGIAGKSAAAQGNGTAAGKPKGIPLLIDELEISLDAKRAVIEDRELGTCHEVLRWTN